MAPESTVARCVARNELLGGWNFLIIVIKLVDRFHFSFVDRDSYLSATASVINHPQFRWLHKSMTLQNCFYITDSYITAVGYYYCSA